MENFLPGLLIIGAIIYKIYSEYKKEQENVRRRMQQNRNPPPSVPPVVFEEQQPRPTVTQPTITPPTLSEPVAPPIPKVEYYVEVPETVKKAREARERNQNRTNSLTKTIVKPVVDLDEEEQDGVTSFDLRDAVIQSAILNRPHS